MLNHIDEKNQPTMVDVTGKKITERIAIAQTLIQLPREVENALRGDELYLKKGPVFQTAIIAGTMAVKKTHELIPFCHPLPIESCKIKITIDAKFLVTVQCEVKTTGKTGVEMEALTGATLAALTIYDMCKAVSHEIALSETRLIAKTGGKKTVLDRPLYGLILTGGKSERMGTNKALLNYRGEPHAKVLRELLLPYCKEVYLSTQVDQWAGTNLEGIPSIVDSVKGKGPMGGILSAFEKHPEANWFVVACDLVHLNQTAIQALLSNYRSESIATVFKSREAGFPEALCGIYTPRAKGVFEAATAEDIRCPVKVLRNSDAHCLDQTEGIDLANINTVEEFKGVIHEYH